MYQRVQSAGTLLSNGMLIPPSGELAPAPDAQVTPGTAQYEAAVREKRMLVAGIVALAGMAVGGIAGFMSTRHT
jgi:hypothetical protein